MLVFRLAVSYLTPFLLDFSFYEKNTILWNFIYQLIISQAKKESRKNVKTSFILELFYTIIY